MSKVLVVIRWSSRETGDRIQEEMSSASWVWRFIKLWRLLFLHIYSNVEMRLYRQRLLYAVHIVMASLDIFLISDVGCFLKFHLHLLRTALASLTLALHLPLFGVSQTHLNRNLTILVPWFLRFSKTQNHMLTSTETVCTQCESMPLQHEEEWGQNRGCLLCFWRWRKALPLMQLHMVWAVLSD